MLECVVNVSEGRDRTRLDHLAAVCGDDLLDLHVDPDHNRSVFTLVGEFAPRALAAEVVGTVDLRTHQGVHPRIGALDVVPFVALAGSTPEEALAARDAFSGWAGTALDLPCFLYGPERTLPAVRRLAFRGLEPDTGPAHPHPTAGACAVGVRPPMVAYNVWVTAPDLAAVRRTAAAVRGPWVRVLGLRVGARWQVSCNLLAPESLGPAELVALVADRGTTEGVEVAGTELVGLIPASVLDGVDVTDRDRLDLSPDRTIEARVDRRGR